MLNLLKRFSFSFFALAPTGYYTAFNFFCQCPDFLGMASLVHDSLYAFGDFSKYLAVVVFTVKIGVLFC